MEVILSRYCKSFTGKMSKRHGYAICQRGGRFFGQRNRKDVPADGHLRFIFDCAELAQEGMLLANIRVPGEEMIEAAEEAGLEFETVVPDVEYNAHDVMNIKKYYSL